MKKKDKEEYDDFTAHILMYTFGLILLILMIIIIFLITAPPKKILYEGDCFEIYQKGEKVFIINKDIYGGIVELDPEDPNLQRLFQKAGLTE